MDTARMGAALAILASSLRQFNPLPVFLWVESNRLRLLAHSREAKKEELELEKGVDESQWFPLALGLCRTGIFERTTRDEHIRMQNRIDQGIKP